MSPHPQPGKPEGKGGSVQALVKAEKLTQIAFILPISVAVGWLLGVLLDKLLHQHWIYIVGLVLGMLAGFVQLFRMIAAPSTLASTAYDFQAPKGSGFGKDEEKDDRRS